MSDPVYLPNHYRWIENVECADVAGNFNFYLGSVIKYVWRADHKDNPIQDLEKAAEMLRREIARRKRTERSAPKARRHHG